ncbi:hypothetical protein BGZ80_009216 [Entomortierella chlamydospora]|uniref:Casein kinase substrate phosphoprotein pp28 n=1 Tax=Entomortierella chlamydospora TaxID=101097 RepID=A0A9P6T0N2_9FUNG|nr:hypothetical protein BGZ80_009216 [Entomortierella chlamydospora]
MAGGKFKKPQRGGGRTFSRRIEAVHTTNNYRDREESEEDSSAESSEESGSGSESESESEEEAVAPKKKAPAAAPAIDIANPNRAAGNRVMKASDLATPIEMSRKERDEAAAAKAEARKR